MAAPPLAENFQLKWHSFGSHLHASVATLLHSETFADVVLSTADGRHVSAHRFVLAACSSYLQGLLGPGSLAANGHLPVVVIMPSEISHHTLCTLIKYMYSGEATVSHSQLDAVLRAGDILRIRGLYRPPTGPAAGSRGSRGDKHHHHHHHHHQQQQQQDGAGGSQQPHHLLRSLEGYARGQRGSGARSSKREEQYAAGLVVHRHFMDPTRGSSSEPQHPQQDQEGGGPPAGHQSSRVHRTYMLGRRGNREAREVSARELRERKEMRRRERTEHPYSAAQQNGRANRESSGQSGQSRQASQSVQASQAGQADQVSLLEKVIKTEAPSSMETDTEGGEHPGTEQDGEEITAPGDAEGGRASRSSSPSAVAPEASLSRSGDPEDAPDAEDQDTQDVKCTPEGFGEDAAGGSNAAASETDKGRSSSTSPKSSTGGGNKENHTRSRSRNAHSPETRTNGDENDLADTATILGGIGALAGLVVGEMKIKEEPIEWDMESEVRQALLEDLPSGVRVKPEQPEEAGPGRGELMYSPLTCDFCNQTFFCPGDWVRHTETQHAEMRRRPRRRAPRGRLSSHDSDRSGQSASTSGAGHRAASGSGSASGALTGGSPTAGSGTPSESSSVRSGYPELVCDVCHESFGSPGVWARHLQSSHTDEELALHNKKNPSHQQYIRQFPLKCLPALRPIPQGVLSCIRPSRRVARRCGLCSKSFLSKASLQIHRRTHTGERPYLCHHCDKGFNVKSNFLRHMRTVHNRVISPTSALAAMPLLHRGHAQAHAAPPSREEEAQGV